jgi:hypothetical protein
MIKIGFFASCPDLLPPATRDQAEIRCFMGFQELHSNLVELWLCVLDHSTVMTDAIVLAQAIATLTTTSLLTLIAIKIQ